MDMIRRVPSTKMARLLDLQAEPLAVVLVVSSSHSWSAAGGRARCTTVAVLALLLQQQPPTVQTLLVQRRQNNLPMYQHGLPYYTGRQSVRICGTSSEPSSCVASLVAQQRLIAEFYLVDRGLRHRLFRFPPSSTCVPLYLRRLGPLCFYALFQHRW